MIDFQLKNENLKELDSKKDQINLKDTRSRTMGKFADSKI